MTGALISPATRLTLIYAVLGALWVIGSNWLVARVDSLSLIWGAAGDGLLFVVLSSAVVYLLCARELKQKRMTAEERKRVERRLAAAARFEAIGQLTGGIAHDFNNLITAIAGNLDTYLGRKDNGTDPVELVEARRSADRATDLTRQLLAFGRRQVLHPERIDLNTVIRDMSALLHRLIGDRVRITTDFDCDLGMVHVDPGRLEQVVMNLAINARDAMPDGGELRLRTSNEVIDEGRARHFAFPFQPGSYVRLDVIDAGLGMDADTQAHIFEPFFTTKPKDVGTGLGLSTVYGIVKQSGGYIDVASTPGDGATFSLFFPESPDRAPRVEDAAVAPVDEDDDSGSETVLVVEDDADVRSVVIRVLQGRGFAVLEAPDGPEALDVLRDASGHVDLLITDAVMPEMEGRQLIAKVQKQYPDLRVLLMSGYDAERAGVAAYLAKPFTPAQLTRTVRQILDD
jgi:two-component system cell cycle sensor histidine kinase/response regulator CckA